MAQSPSLLIATALKGGSPQLRVSQGLRPVTGTLPAVVFSIVAGEDDPDLDGNGGLRIARVQIDAWGTTPADAEAGADEALALMMGSTAFAASPLGWFADQEDATLLFRVSRDFSVSITG